MTPLLGLPDSLSGESYAPGYTTFGQMASGGAPSSPDSVATESNGGSLTTLDQFSQWQIGNFDFTQWALLFGFGWLIAEVLKKRGF